MLDLYTARQVYWEKEHRVLTYQQIWADIRHHLAETYRAVCAGLELKDNVLSLHVHGTFIARFEIK